MRKYKISNLIIAYVVLLVIAVIKSEYSSDASDVVYDYKNVSITSALDNYIINNSLDTATQTDADITALATDTMESDSTEELIGDLSQFEGKALVTVDGEVNIRSEATAESERVGTITAGGLMDVIEQGTEWTYISSGGCQGYIKNEFISFGDDAGIYAEAYLPKAATISTTSLRVRAGEGENYDIVTLISGGDAYPIISLGDEWTYIEIDDSVSGYIKNEYYQVSYMISEARTITEIIQPEETTTDAVVENTTEAPSDSTTAPTTEAPVVVEGTTSGGAADVCAFALQYVGYPYVYGGSSLTGGTDCSGFTMRVYEQFGYSLPRSAAGQSGYGVEVSMSEIVPGDLLFYSNDGVTIGHVALYIGNGQVVHASSPGVGIIVSNMYYRTPSKAMRVIY